MGISDEEFQTLAVRARTLPPARGVYVQTDYITNLFLAVLDYRSTAESVRRALAHFREKWGDQIRTLTDLKTFLNRYEDSPEGNLFAGSDLWGFRAARRVKELRGLVAFFESRDVVNQEALSRWAHNSSYRDFMGRVKGLDLPIYEAILTRLGCGPIKPSRYLMSFISTGLRRPVAESELVPVLKKLARELDMREQDLERRIFEFENM
ncbi:MAG: hypothetical protein WD602_07780 [Actinomycetota bacterium]